MGGRPKALNIEPGWCEDSAPQRSSSDESMATPASTEAMKKTARRFHLSGRGEAMTLS